MADCFRAMEHAKDQVASGWHGIIERLVADLAVMGWDGHVRLVRRHHGDALVFSIVSNDILLWRRIERAREESEHTCENCGDPGKDGLCLGCASFLGFPR